MLISAAAICGAAVAPAAEPLEVKGAETVFDLNVHILEDIGLEIVLKEPVARLGYSDGAAYQAQRPVTLRIRAPAASFEGLEGGSLVHHGGFELVWKEGRLSVPDFELTPAEASAPALFDLRAPDGTHLFELVNAHTQYLAELNQFVFLNMDLQLAGEFAAKLGRPEYSGAAIGSAEVRTELVSPPGPALRGGACPPVTPGPKDVQLESITGLVEGVHDDDRVAIAPSASLSNVGERSVPWERAIAPDGGGAPVGQHPFLALHLYRIADGVIEQIGAADVKHAFFSINSGCACAGGQILYPGCGDVYGSGTNFSRFHLAPRAELSAFGGDWVSLGSHFDATPVNDFRDHQGESDHDDYEHRLVVRTADLQTAGAEYFIEAWYVVKEDENIFNSMGYRGTSPQQVGGVGGGWTFPFTGSLTYGPAIEAWVDPAAPPPGAASVLIEDRQGYVRFASATELLPSGAYRYTYAVHNLDFDPQLRSLSVPLPAGINVANLGFFDGDDDPSNDWQATVGASEILWTTPAGDPSLGAIDWGSLASFRFDANAAPTDALATLGVLEPGDSTELTATMKVPDSTPTAANRLDVSVAGNGPGSGSGTVTSSPAGIDCAPDCDELYASGAPVELTAVPDAGSELLRWTEGGVTVGTAGTYDTVLDTDRSIEAVFARLCDEQLGAQTVDDTQTFEACEVLTVEAGFEVGATGDVTLRAGIAVVLENDVSVATGGKLTVEIDTSLLP